MREWFSATELSGLPGMPSAKRAIAVKAKRKSWRCREVSGNGGKILEFHLEELPEETQAYLNSIYKEQDGRTQPDRDDRTGNPSDDRLDPSPVHAVALVEHTELVGGQIAPILPTSGTQKLATKPEKGAKSVGRPKGAKGNAKIDAWVEIFKARKAWCATQGIAKQVDCDGAFSEAYLRHEIALPEEVYETVTRISRSTIARKRSENEHGGVTALAGKEGAGRPK
jgi:Mu DNA-binding domain